MQPSISYTWLKRKVSLFSLIFFCQLQPASSAKGDNLTTHTRPCSSYNACMHIQSCPTLCNPMDGSLPGFSVHGIFQARILEWVAIIFSRGSSRLRDWTHVSCIGRRILYHWATEEVAVIKGMLRVWGRGVIEDDMHDWIGMERSFLHLWRGYFNNFVKWLYNRIYILICVGHILFMTCPPMVGQNSL